MLAQYTFRELSIDSSTSINSAVLHTNISSQWPKLYIKDTKDSEENIYFPDVSFTRNDEIVYRFTKQVNYDINQRSQHLLISTSELTFVDHVSAITSSKLTNTYTAPVASGTDSLAISSGAQTYNDASVAVGVGAQAHGARSVALGVESYIAEDAVGSVALGYQSSATESGVVSIGTGSRYRRLVNLADPQDMTDSVNLHYLYNNTVMYYSLNESKLSAVDTSELAYEIQKLVAVSTGEPTAPAFCSTINRRF